MKNLMTLFFSLWVIMSVDGQEPARQKHNLRTEAGYVFSGNNDIKGISLYSEFQRYLGNRIKWAFGIGSYNHSMPGDSTRRGWSLIQCLYGA